MIAGYAAIDRGLSAVEALGFSVLMFAGSAQLAAIDLLGSGAPVWVALLTVLVINARMLMYSASLAPHLAGESLPRRAGAAYLLTDHAYAVAITRQLRTSPPPRALPYYLGAASTQWAGWQLWTVLGVALGGLVPADSPADFGVPLAFLALLVPAITDRATLAAAVVAGAVVAGAVATLLVDAPANLGMPAAAVAGIAVGASVAHRSRRWT